MFFNKISVTKFDQIQFDRAWCQYVDCAMEAHPPFISYLNAGATISEIEKAEQAVETPFPEDLKYLLSQHNGSEDYFVLPGWELFSAQRLVDEWKVWANLYKTQFKPENYKCNPVGKIGKDEWWRMKWLPFCGDGGGNHLCIDMDPLKGGTIGQVITMWHDDGHREIIAKSLTAFVQLIANDFENGKLTWDEDMGGVYQVFED